MPRCKTLHALRCGALCFRFDWLNFFCSWLANLHWENKRIRLQIPEVSEHATEQEFTKAALTTRARSWREAAALKRRILETHVSGDPAYDPDLLWRVSSPLDIGKKRLLN
jgi:hypothetical protein